MWNQLCYFKSTFENRLHAEETTKGDVVCFRTGMHWKYSKPLRLFSSLLAFTTWLQASGQIPCSQSPPTTGRLSAILQHGIWERMTTGTAFSVTLSRSISSNIHFYTKYAPCCLKISLFLYSSLYSSLWLINGKWQTRKTLWDCKTYCVSLPVKI